jgi:hypothetical protein
MTQDNKDTNDISKQARNKEARDTNRDPITKAQGSHPVGTGVGAAAGGVAGAAAGIAASAATGLATGTVLGGPIGGLIGLTAGAVAGGLAGKAIGEAVNPTLEDQFWRESYKAEPYHDSSYTYDDYSPAYRTGYEGYGRYKAQSFEDAEKSLEQDYNRNRGKSKLNWQSAKVAARSAWDRVTGDHRVIPRDQREGSSRHV